MADTRKVSGGRQQSSVGSAAGAVPDAERTTHNGQRRSRSLMLLYGNAASGHSYKVRLYLLLAGIEHEYRPISYNFV